MIYLVDPVLTRSPVSAGDLFDGLVARLQTYSAISRVSTEEAAYSGTPGSADAVVFANPEPPAVLTDAAAHLVEQAHVSGAMVIPVAASAGSRTPPAPVEAMQSFDVADRLERRSLPASATGLISAELARRVLARVQPTMAKGELRVFLSYRRADGEGQTRDLDVALSARHGHVFRDLVDIQDGAAAQDAIEDELAKADVLVFLDTPQAGSSDWVAQELGIALGRQVPIVWVKLGGEDDRMPLQVKPGSSPHLSVAGAVTDWSEVADAVLDKAFDLAREHVRVAQSTFFRIRRQAVALGREVQTLDQRQLIYALTETGVDTSGYPRRPQSDVVQVFGHRPTPEDRLRLERWLVDNDFGPHSRTCRAYDAAVLLDPLPRDAEIEVETSVVLDSAEAFLARMQPAVVAASPRTLLLLGAFSEGVDSQEPVKQAVHAFASQWVGRGGRIVFGGHPTFTPLVVEAARSVVGDRAPAHVTIFQSEYWVSQSLARAFERLATMVLVSATRDLGESLTLMRTRMVEESGADLAVVVGGRTSEGGFHVPGVDEEIALVAGAGVPVYLVGAPGGRAAELAAEAPDRSPGRLTADRNAWLAATEDYVDAARVLWDEG